MSSAGGMQSQQQSSAAGIKQRQLSQAVNRGAHGFHVLSVPSAAKVASRLRCGWCASPMGSFSATWREWGVWSK